jgi:3-hydroxyisobutyrate dehydrogenase-like beta-hydroxyacid dehydrogenase
MRRFGLIGHGVVGSLFARLLSKNGAEVLSYDVLLDDPEKGESARAKMQADGARAATFDETIAAGEYLLAVTPTQACVQAAKRAAACLRPEQVYCDLASASPAVKRRIAAIVAPTGATFVEGAILGAVGASLTCPAILLGGEAAELLSDVLNSHALKTSAYSKEIGPASAFKMIRSVFSKGMETLLIETLVSARRAGLLDEIWAEIRGTLAPDRMERMLQTWIRSHAISSGRRYCEMQEVARYLEELRVPPLITRAAAETFRRSTQLGIAKAFESEPRKFTDVIDFIADRVPE